MRLVPGLYEQVISGELQAALRRLGDSLGATREMLGAQEGPHLLARLLHDAALRALRSVRGEGKDDAEKSAARLHAQVSVANEVLRLLGELAPNAEITDEEHVREPAEMLLALRELADVRLGRMEVARPTLPLRQSDLLVNGPRDLRVGHEVRLELASADRVDLLVSFVKWSGFRLLRPELMAFLARRPGALRVLTTTYMGATDAAAVEGLLELGANVKVSYDSRRTGRRYRGLTEQPWRTLLFVRHKKWDARGVTEPYLFLGPARYVSHEKEKPMRIVWELDLPMPAGLFNDVKVAAG